MQVLAEIRSKKIVAIIRGAHTTDVLKIAGALAKGGVKIIEVTLNSPAAIESIRSLVHAFGDDLLIGAGTVLSAGDVTKCIEAGAQFIISPNTNKEVIAATKEMNVVSIPGAFTATEIVSAHEAGGDIIKIFPATDPAYIRALQGPLSHIPMMPTGGIQLENIQSFAASGAIAFGIGSALVEARQDLSSKYLDALSGKASKFVRAIS